MSQVPSIPEKVSTRKVVVYKSRVDPTIVKLTAEKMKHKLFAKPLAPKNRTEEIRVVSVDKYYEPYIIIDANYSIRYFKRRVYSLGVDPETEEVKISGVAYLPETDTGETGEPRKNIKLEAEMWSSYQDKAYLVLNKEGQEISLDQVPAAPSEDHPKEILKEFSKKTKDTEGSVQKELEFVKARIVKRPTDMTKIAEELFQVCEHTAIYSPIYQITFKNMRTGEEKHIKMDGVTAKIIS